MSDSRFDFRAWDGEYMRTNDVYPPSNQDWDQWEQSLGCMIQTFCNEPGWVLMQSAGLCDTHGERIFEGDVVRYKTKGGYSVDGVAPVEYFAHPYCFIALAGGGARYKTNRDSPLGSSGSSTAYKPYTWASYKTLEVLGNIYANANLLDI